jgi:hypothetical protein
VLDLALTIDEPAGWVALLRVDILQGDGEVDNVEVEVVNTPVGQLLAADGLDLFTLVEGLPELADDEEVFSLYEAFLDGASYTLTALDFVAVICGIWCQP